MKKMKFEITINAEKYLMKYSYQNLSFPLFRFDVYGFKFFGIYWNPINLRECGSLIPSECVDWDSNDFEKNGINTIEKHLSIDSDTTKGIRNFKKIMD